MGSHVREWLRGVKGLLAASSRLIHLGVGHRMHSLLEIHCSEHL